MQQAANPKKQSIQIYRQWEHSEMGVSVYLLKVFLKPFALQGLRPNTNQAQSRTKANREAWARALPFRFCPPPKMVTSFSLCPPARKRLVLDDICFSMHKYLLSHGNNFFNVLFFFFFLTQGLISVAQPNLGFTIILLPQLPNSGITDVSHSLCLAMS